MFCTARGSQTVSTVAVLSWIPPAVWEGRSQFFHVLANTCHFPIFPPKVVLSVKRCFTVADSVSPMTNDSEQSPVVLVFLLSLDPVPCPRTPPTPPPNWLPVPGRVSSQPGHAARVGYPTFGCWECCFVLFKLFWLGRALNWNLSGSSDSELSSCWMQALHLVLPSSWGPPLLCRLY